MFVLSAMGIETVILPTAVLSTHTMFQNFTVKDLSDQIKPITEHWKQENIKFDAIYTGYLGTPEEIELAKNIFQEFKQPDSMIFVDPVMADNGKLYPAFDMAYAKKNAELCAAADVIVPNITEACFMTGIEYQENYNQDYIINLLKKLAELGAKIIIITGVSLSHGKTGAMGYNTNTGEFFSYQNNLIPAKYHGTGDLFSSVCAGAILRGKDLQSAIKLAADYTAETIQVTLKNPNQPWYGVDFESTLPALIDAMRE